WFPPNQPSVPYGDPANPLGERWLGFESADGFRGFGIHGTNEPETIGLEASEGCIRLVNEDVVALYPFVAIGTRVTIRD
ncbi:MAG: L,D-transpeptidase, partial [Planctomycetota bacterium]